jgi:hypothetical protein
MSNVPFLLGFVSLLFHVLIVLSVTDLHLHVASRGFMRGATPPGENNPDCPSKLHLNDFM